MMVPLLFVAGKGIASIPRGSLVIIAGVLPYFHLPAGAVSLVLAVN